MVRDPLSFRREVLTRWQALLRAEAYVLRDGPGLLCQQVANQSALAPAAKAARRRLSREGRPWLRRLDAPPRSAGGGGVVTLAALAGSMTIHAVHPDGRVLAEAVRRQRQAGPPRDLATLRLWEVASGKELISFYEDAPCRLCALAPRGIDRFVTISTEQRWKWYEDPLEPRGSLRELSLRDAATGAVIASFPGSVPCLFANDGRSLLAAADDGSLVLRASATGAELARRTGPTSEREDGTRRPALDGRSPCAFSPDGRWLRLAEQGGVSLLDGSTLRELARWEQTTSDRFSPDGRWLVVHGEGATLLVEAATLDEARRWEGKVAVTFSPDGRWLLVEGEAGARLLAAASLEEAAGWEEATGGGVFSPNCRLLALPERGGSLLIALDSLTAIAALGGREVLFAPDGRRLLHGPPAALWDVTTRAAIAELAGAHVLFASRRGGAVFSPDGGRLRTADGVPLRVWDAASARLLVDGSGHSARVRSLAFLADGSALLSSADDGTLRIRSLGQVAVTAGAAEESPLPATVTGLAFSAGGEEVVCATVEQGLVLLDGSSARRRSEAVSRLAVHGLSVDGETYVRQAMRNASPLVVCSRSAGELCVCRPHGKVRFCAVTPDRTRVLSVSSAGEVALWATDEGPQPQPVRLLEGGLGRPPLCGAFSPDGTVVALCYLGGSIELWSVPTARCLREHRLRGTTADGQDCAFSADGLLFTLAHRRGATVWELRDKTVVAEHVRPGGASAVAFARGRLLAVGSAAGHLWIYRQDDWRLVGETRVGGCVSRLAWSPEGDRLAVAAAGALVLLAPVGLGN